MRLAWQQIPSTVISDILCQNDLDGVVLDSEHSCYNKETLYSCIQVVSLNNKKFLLGDNLSIAERTMSGRVVGGIAKALDL